MNREQAELIGRAIELARRLQERATELQTPEERRQQAELDRMVQQPADRATLVQMTDQAFRSSVPERAVDQLAHVLDVQGIPRFFSPLDRTLLRGLQSFGGYLPGVAAPLVKEKMQHETANVILPAEPDELAAHLRARRDAGVRMNVNFLGEALLGEADAGRRLEHYLKALQSPDVEVISVKISTLFSQISPLARAHTLEVLRERLARLFRAAAEARYRRADGREVPKFVYMDMEEYRDMSITADAFMLALDRADLSGATAGLALQAYIPDSFATQRRITAWAMRRVARGGQPVVLRIVKGANVEMERVQASVSGWPQAPFKTKRETDANYKRMLHYALEPEHAAAVGVGVASHNLFELAYGLVLADSRATLDRVQFEMLEGMANHHRRALFERVGNLLLYAPACRKDEFINAIGYLIRRLDENTGADNFLRHAFKLEVDSDEWRRLENDFRISFDTVESLPDQPRRTQDRRRPPAAAVDDDAPWQRFTNEPDTDWSLPHHAEWADSIYARWRGRHGDRALYAPLVIGGGEVHEPCRTGESEDPSRPGVIVGRYRIADVKDVEKAIACARDDADGWCGRPAASRGAVLRRVAQHIRERRADLMGVALAEGGKILAESDSEVSEAVDFCGFYARVAEDLSSYPGVGAGAGVVAVVPPWNFPISIPCGGVAAALAAGNTVILKPAPATVLTAYLLCECFWAAGVSKKTLQFVYGDDDAGATALVTHDGVDTVVFTGGTDTAMRLLSRKPRIRLLAETGGKNAMIVTAMSDRELAIKHTVHSAFSHAGQKCSATSLLILEDEVYRDERFKRTLRDAVESLPVGSAWSPATKVGPLIRPPAPKLEAALRTLEDEESWLVEPRVSPDNPRLWSPGVKWDVRAGSSGHMTELFGPVLAVMRAADLDEAVALVNATGYGLTAGLQSLDDREHEAWAASVRAGNLYVNRGTTGAVVLRQPFGGVGKSSIGLGVKAGGPNYLVPLMRVRDEAGSRGAEAIDDGRVAGLLVALAERGLADAETHHRLGLAARSYTRMWREEFGVRHDHFRLLGQDNWRSYRPVERLVLRVGRGDSAFEIVARVCAAAIAGSRVQLSHDPEDASALVEALGELTRTWEPPLQLLGESDEGLAERIRQGQVGRVRYAADEHVPLAVRRAAARAGLCLATAPVVTEGRIELLWYLSERSLSVDYHRYGNLGARAGEDRAVPD